MFPIGMNRFCIQRETDSNIPFKIRKYCLPVIMHRVGIASSQPVNMDRQQSRWAVERESSVIKIPGFILRLSYFPVRPKFRFSLFAELRVGGLHGARARVRRLGGQGRLEG